uniref:7TM_GPCR_Srx domain-containing protein n=1 Tax=Heterorhabditis bacteriophora TaxID=37862 RepID=A0A1I7WTC8_HETBA
MYYFFYTIFFAFIDIVCSIHFFSAAEMLFFFAILKYVTLHYYFSLF